MADTPVPDPQRIDAGFEATREAARIRNQALAGATGAVGGWQLLDQARELAAYYFPDQPEILWTFLLSIVAFALGGGFNRIVRALEQ